MGYKTSYEKFKQGIQLTRTEAMQAQCFECNGLSAEIKDDCLGKSCPLYQWSPWKANSHISRDAVKKRRTRVKTKQVSCVS